MKKWKRVVSVLLTLAMVLTGMNFSNWGSPVEAKAATNGGHVEVTWSFRYNMQGDQIEGWFDASNMNFWPSLSANLKWNSSGVDFAFRYVDGNGNITALTSSDLVYDSSKVTLTERSETLKDISNSSITYKIYTADFNGVAGTYDFKYKTYDEDPCVQIIVNQFPPVGFYTTDTLQDARYINGKINPDTCKTIYTILDKNTYSQFAIDDSNPVSVKVWDSKTQSMVDLSNYISSFQITDIVKVTQVTQNEKYKIEIENNKNFWDALQNNCNETQFSLWCNYSDGTQNGLCIGLDVECPTAYLHNNQGSFTTPTVGLNVAWAQSTGNQQYQVGNDGFYTGMSRIPMKDIFLTFIYTDANGKSQNPGEISCPANNNVRLEKVTQQDGSPAKIAYNGIELDVYCLSFPTAGTYTLTGTASENASCDLTVNRFAYFYTDEACSDAGFIDREYECPSSDATIYATGSDTWVVDNFEAYFWGQNGKQTIISTDAFTVTNPVNDIYSLTLKNDVWEKYGIERYVLQLNCHDKYNSANTGKWTIEIKKEFNGNIYVTSNIQEDRSSGQSVFSVTDNFDNTQMGTGFPNKPYIALRIVDKNGNSIVSDWLNVYARGADKSVLDADATNGSNPSLMTFNQVGTTSFNNQDLPVYQLGTYSETGDYWFDYIENDTVLYSFKITIGFVPAAIYSATTRSASTFLASYNLVDDKNLSTYIILDNGWKIDYLQAIYEYRYDETTGNWAPLCYDLGTVLKNWAPAGQAPVYWKEISDTVYEIKFLTGIDADEYIFRISASSTPNSTWHTSNDTHIYLKSGIIDPVYKVVTPYGTEYQDCYWISATRYNSSETKVGDGVTFASVKRETNNDYTVTKIYQAAEVELFRVDATWSDSNGWSIQSAEYVDKDTYSIVDKTNILQTGSAGFELAIDEPGTYALALSNKVTNNSDGTKSVNLEDLYVLTVSCDFGDLGYADAQGVRINSMPVSYKKGDAIELKQYDDQCGLSFDLENITYKVFVWDDTQGSSVAVSNPEKYVTYDKTTHKFTMTGYRDFELEARVKVTDADGYHWYCDVNRIYFTSTEKQSLADATVTLSNETGFTYDGTPKVPTVTVTLDDEIIPDSEYEVSYSNTNDGDGIGNIGAGTVTVTVTAKSDGNYTGVATQKPTFTIAKKKLSVSGLTWVVGTYTYNGTAQGPVLLGTVPEQLSVVKTGDSATDKGDYVAKATFTVKTEHAANYEIDGNSEISANWSIAAKNISNAAIVLGPSLTYNGTAQTQTVSSVKIGEETVTYSVSDNENTNAGTYTLTVTGTGNYTGTLTKTYSIAKKNVTPSITGTVEKTYDGTTGVNGASANTLAISLSDVVASDSANVSATATSYVFGSVNVSDSATVTASGIKLTGSAATNYKLIDTTASAAVGKIAKATPSIILGNLRQVSNNVGAVTATLAPASADATVTIEYKILKTPAVAAVEGHECKYASGHTTECATMAENAAEGVACDCGYEEAKAEHDAGRHTASCGYVEAVEAQEAVYEWTTIAPTTVGRYEVRAYLAAENAGANLSTAGSANLPAVTGTLVITVYTAPSGGNGGNSGNDVNGGNSANNSSGSSNTTPTTPVETPAEQSNEQVESQLTEEITTVVEAHENAEEATNAITRQEEEKPERIEEAKPVIVVESEDVVISVAEAQEKTVVTATLENNNVEAWNSIETVITDSLDQADENTAIEVVVEMNETSEVPALIIESIAGKNIALTLDMGDGIAWTINGNDVAGVNFEAIDLKVTRDAGEIPAELVASVVEDKEAVTISLAHDGEFGFSAVLTIRIEKKNAGKYANLYYFNESTGELEFMCSSLIDEEGNADLTFVHASDYVIVLDEEPVVIAENSNKNEEQSTEKAENEESVNNVENEEIIEENSANNLTWLIIVIAALVLLITGGVIILLTKKKNEE